MRNSKAFLLLEVMLAVVIVSAGLLSVGRVYSAVKGAIDKSRLLLASSLLLEEKMFDIQCAEDLSADHSMGEFPDNKACRWEYRAMPLEAGPSGLFKITLGVFLPSKEKSADTYWLETYIKKCKPETAS